MKKAVVLLSGGLDSTTTLYWACHKKFDCVALIIDYNQRHKKEVRHAVRIAKLCRVPYTVISLPLPWKGSALLDKTHPIPAHTSIGKTIPSTYVPCRNIIFLSCAASYAEAMGATTLLIGANSVDYSGYPDCRGTFLKAMERAINVGTKQGTTGKRFRIVAPLLTYSKAEIILLGKKLGVPFHLTWSCYKGEKKPCGVCDSCRLRDKGFQESEKIKNL